MGAKPRKCITTWKASTEAIPRDLPPSRRFSLLIIDEDENIRWLLQKKFAQLDFDVDVTSDKESMIKYLEKRAYTAIILDTMFDDGLLFPADCQERHVAQEVDWFRYGIIGQSDLMQRLYHRTSQIAHSDAGVLLTGESGTGKELFARAIHQLSPRSENPFLAINCAAISPTLMEAELFGCRKGAFTDSKHDRKGFFEVCSQGTLMLDEIGEMPVELQAKLLRVLQEHEVIPVGSCTRVQVNTRVIAVTNCNLEEMVRLGKFRKDLYYRLAIVKLTCPPLRAIKSDLEALVGYFFKKYNCEFKKTVKFPDAETIARLKAYDWPGNIRELQNAVERGILFAENDRVAVEDLLPALSSFDEAEFPATGDIRGESHEQEIIPSSASKAVKSVWKEVLREMPLHYLEAKKCFEKQYLEFLLGETRGVIAQAAEVSGQYRPNLYRMIKKYAIDVDAFKL